MHRITRALIFLVAASSAAAIAADAPPHTPATFINPLKANGADPCLFYYDGYCYLTVTTGHDVRLRRAARLDDLKSAADTVVWHDDNPTRNKALWAPEFHLLDTPQGKRWFLYFTACNGKEPNHRIYVCQSLGTDPMGPYTFKGQLKTDPEDKFYAIDATILTQKTGKLYVVWCGRPSNTGQGLYIAPLSDPLTVSGPRLSLQASGFPAAGQKQPPVREGPEILQHAGRTFLVYSSSSADTPDYKLGALVCADTADPMKAESWTQHPTPLLVRRDAAGIYGPGHCFFFKSPDGTQDWIAYHAKTTSNITYADRATFAQPITWTQDGLPDFGLPQPAGTPLPVPSGEKK